MHELMDQWIKFVAESGMEPECPGTQFTVLPLDNFTSLSKKIYIFMHIFKNN